MAAIRQSGVQKTEPDPEGWPPLSDAMIWKSSFSSACVTLGFDWNMERDAWMQEQNEARAEKYYG